MLKKIIKDYQDLEKEVKFWISDLEKYNENPFQRKLEGCDFSIAEIYFYISRLIVIHVANTIESGIEKKIIGSKKSLFSKLSLQKKKLPAKKIQPLLAEFSFSEEFDKESAKSSLFKLLKVMNKLKEEITEENSQYVVNHKTLGEITIEYCYGLPLMYIHYFLTEKEKIDMKLSSKK